MFQLRVFPPALFLEIGTSKTPTESSRFDPFKKVVWNPLRTHGSSDLLVVYLPIPGVPNLT